MTTQETTKQTLTTATDTGPAALTPESFVDQLRVLRQQVPDLEPLTKEQRRLLRGQGRMSNGAVQASISAIGASGKVSQVLEAPAEEVRQLVDETNRWIAAEDELRKMLKGVSDANLIRRQRTALLAGQAYLISQQLVRDPKNAELRPHVEEIQRQRRLSRGRSRAAAQTPQVPAPPASES